MRKKVLLLLGGVLSIGFCQNSQAEVYTGGFNPRRLANLRWASSLPEQYINDYIAPGAKNWNGISPKITYNRVNIKSPYDVEVKLGATTTEGLVGLVVPHCNSSPSIFGERCTKVGNWIDAKVIGYSNQIKLIGLTKSQIISTVYTHEFGHVLSLDHTKNRAIRSVMRSAISDYPPRDIDKENLINRWNVKY